MLFYIQMRLKADGKTDGLKADGSSRNCFISISCACPEALHAGILPLRVWICAFACSAASSSQMIGFLREARIQECYHCSTLTRGAFFCTFWQGDVLGMFSNVTCGYLCASKVHLCVIGAMELRLCTASREWQSLQWFYKRPKNDEDH